MGCFFPKLQPLLAGGKRRVAGWVAGGCWDYEIDSDEMDHFLNPCV